jgi:Outer membrane lipoprotein-sorting protein
MNVWKIITVLATRAATSFSVAIAYCVISLNAAGADLSVIAVPELRACLERNMPRHSMKQELTFSVFDNNESVGDNAGTLYWKRFQNGLVKVYFRIEGSQQYDGVAVLMEERNQGKPDIFMYLPSLRSERRITGTALAGPLLGTDFSYEDFALLQNLGRSNELKQLPDTEVDGRPTFVIETMPVDKDSSYSRVQTLVDKQWCLPVVTRFFGLNGTLFKELQIDHEKVRGHGDSWIPYRSVMHNHKTNTRTELNITSIELDQILSDDLFSLSQLRRGR